MPSPFRVLSIALYKNWNVIFSVSANGGSLHEAQCKNEGHTFKIMKVSTLVILVRIVIIIMLL